METKISKWGNSYAVRIPASVIKAKGLKEGDKVIISEIAKTFENPLKELAGCLKGITKISKEQFYEARKELEGENW